MFSRCRSPKHRLPCTLRRSFIRLSQIHLVVLILTLLSTTWRVQADSDDDQDSATAAGPAQGWDLTQPLPPAEDASALKGGTTDLNLVVTELLPYQLGCERLDEDELNCDSGCGKADELGYIRDPAANLAYNPSAFSLGNGRYEVLAQTGCGGDFLERYELDLDRETVRHTGQIRDSSQFLCPEDPPDRPPRPQAHAGPDILPLTTTCLSKGKEGQSMISFFSFGNADAYRGRLAWAHSVDGTSWAIEKEPFLLFPLCAGNNSICEKLGVATAAALDIGNFYYLYVHLAGDGPRAITLMRVEKTCVPPYVVMGPGGAQVFNKTSRLWEELAFDPNDGYLLETCPANPADFEPYELIPNGSSLGVAYSSSDGYLLTHKQGPGQLRYLRSDEPTFDAGNAPSHAIDASLLGDYYRYELCPGGVAPADPDDPCNYSWDIRNHHIELQEDSATGGYLMLFSRMNSTDDVKFRFSSVRVARVEKSPTFTPVLSPSGVSATDGAHPDRVEVRWNPVDGATDYEIWRNTVQKPVAGTRIATVSQTTIYDDETVEADTVYYYWVRAKNNQTTSGYSPSDTGFSSAPTCQEGSLEQEAEDGVLVGFSTVADSAASGGQAIEVPNHEPVEQQENAPNDSFKASYCFTVPTAGTYRIVGREHSPSNSDNSFWVRVDDEPTAGFNWNAKVRHDSYVDDFVNDFNIVDPVEIFLNTGNHIIDVFMREDGALLDHLELELQ